MLTFDLYLQEKLPIERELKMLFRREKPIIIFEIGCCEGEDTIKYSRFFPQAKIYAFEPLPKNFTKTTQHLIKYGVQNAKVFNLALSDKKGNADFYVSSGTPENKLKTDWDYGNKSSSLLEPDKHIEITSFIKFSEKITVETETIENFCHANGISQLDFVHMDVQGAELRVLEGAGSLITKIKSVWLEVANVSLYKNQPLAEEVKAFMENHGFKLVKNKSNNISGDHLYVNKNYLKTLPYLKRLWL